MSKPMENKHWTTWLSEIQFACGENTNCGGCVLINKCRHKEAIKAIRAALLERDALLIENASLRTEVERLTGQRAELTERFNMTLHEKNVAINDRELYKCRAETAEAALAKAEPVLASIRGLSQDDLKWLEWVVGSYIPEYIPRTEGSKCPGRERKDRFRSFLAALKYREEEAK